VIQKGGAWVLARVVSFAWGPPIRTHKDHKLS